MAVSHRKVTEHAESDEESAATVQLNSELTEMCKFMAKITMESETARRVREDEREEQRQEERRREREREEKREDERRREKEEWRREKEERRREEEERRQKHNLKLLQEKRQIDLDRDRKRAAKDVPQLPRLKDGRDIENFLRTLQDQMRMHGVEKAYWSTNLLAVLDDKSLTYQSGLDLADKKILMS